MFSGLHLRESLANSGGGTFVTVVGPVDTGTAKAGILRVGASFLNRIIRYTGWRVQHTKWSVVFITGR